MHLYTIIVLFVWLRKPCPGRAVQILAGINSKGAWGSWSIDPQVAVPIWSIYPQAAVPIWSIYPQVAVPIWSILPQVAVPI